MEGKQIARVHIEMVKDSVIDSIYPCMDTVEKAAEFAKSLYYQRTDGEIRCPAKEIMIVCCVDMKNNPLAVEYVSVGTSTGALVGMKEMFMSAVLCNAVGIFCFHNHPSGIPQPSLADDLITKKLEEAGKILDIPIFDHIIIGESGFYSYEKKSVMEWRKDNEKIEGGRI